MDIGNWLVLMAVVEGDDGPPQISPQVERKLYEGLKKLGGRGTLGDIVRVTGLPLEQTEQDLRTMLWLYRSHLEVDENGELLYLFDPALERRSGAAGQWGQWLSNASEWLWSAFVVTFKVSMMLVLVGYVVLFCALLVLAFLALLTAGEGADVDMDFDGADGCFSVIFELLVFWDVGEMVFIPLVLWDESKQQKRAAAGMPSALSAPGELEPRYTTDTYGVKRSRKPHFHEDIFAFVFGPTVPDPPTKAKDQEILAWINAQRGVITLTELITRTGLSVEDAQQEMTRLLVRYDGQVDIEENGELLYTFQKVRVSAYEAGKLRVEPSPAPPSWHRFEPDAQLNGNTFTRNGIISLMAVFIGIMSVVSMPLTLAFPPAFIFISLLPFMLTMGFFLIPGGRWLGMLGENGARRERNIRRAALLVIFEHIARRQDAPITRATLRRKVRAALTTLKKGPKGAKRNAEERRTMAEMSDVPVKDIDRTLKAIFEEFNAIEDVDDNGDRVLSFPEQAAEMRAADKARLKADAMDLSLGEIIFSTADEDDDMLADEIDALETPSMSLPDDLGEADHSKEVQVEAEHEVSSKRRK